MTYCCIIKGECPKRTQRPDDTSDDFGCVHWWEYAKKMKPQNGGAEETVEVMGCSQTQDILYEILLYIARLNERVPSELGAQRQELSEAMTSLRQESAGGLRIIAEGIRNALTQDSPKIIT